MKYLIAGTGGVGGSIADSCRWQAKMYLYCPWSSFAVDSNERFETEIGFEGRTYAPDSGNYR